MRPASATVLEPSKPQDCERNQTPNTQSWMESGGSSGGHNGVSSASLSTIDGQNNAAPNPLVIPAAKWRLSEPASARGLQRTSHSPRVIICDGASNLESASATPRLLNTGSASNTSFAAAVESKIYLSLATPIRTGAADLDAHFTNRHDQVQQHNQADALNATDSPLLSPLCIDSSASSTAEGAGPLRCPRNDPVAALHKRLVEIVDVAQSPSYDSMLAASQAPPVPQRLSCNVLYRGSNDISDVLLGAATHDTAASTRQFTMLPLYPVAVFGSMSHGRSGGVETVPNDDDDDDGVDSRSATGALNGDTSSNAAARGALEAAVRAADARNFMTTRAFRATLAWAELTSVTYDPSISAVVNE